MRDRLHGEPRRARGGVSDERASAHVRAAPGVAVVPNRSPGTWPADAHHVTALQRWAGNQATVQRFGETVRAMILGTFGAVRIDALDKAGHKRAAAALKKMLDYAVLHGSAGPHGDDSGFHVRLLAAVNDLAGEIAAVKTFDKLPARLQAIVFSAEKLNMDKVAGTPSAQNKLWMTTRPGSEGASNPGVAGSTGRFGAESWKCNKLVADAYLARSGAAIGKSKYPFYGDDKAWSYKANDLAADVDKGKARLEPGKDLKHFPYSQLIHLAADGKSVAEIFEFDGRGKVIAKYLLAGGVFEKHVKNAKGAWEKTKETKNPEELEPGVFAQTGDLVSFHNKEKGESGHTGLNVGHDLFISAMNATEGVGILSISLHMDASKWDHYDYVGFRSFKK
ncbi:MULTISPECIES: hypothetical protein [unclassified Nocardioides]|uniref:hypothetical protein n=1 Tax=unclassified Nocardioides TaxID=2615069 RepID=UPI0006FF52A1|nr:MULTISPECIES: hypothetical protein [unclassified Nocardioides]KRA32777.1 hypothetical protein ASD81_14800 [Nocardioides sp. Root614]KRA89429.1 hypothetical protein ASD84_15065 [Nocardioides sp. Root682]